jgi:Tfp pilus assembly protein PilV
MGRRLAFTLVEILACLLLFSLGLMAVIGVFLYGMKSAAAAQADATAWATALSVL